MLNVHIIKLMINSICRNVEDVSKRTSELKWRTFHASSSILFSSKDRYLCSHKTEVRLVVLHIISFNSSNFGRDFYCQSLHLRIEKWNINELAFIFICIGSSLMIVGKTDSWLWQPTMRKCSYEVNVKNCKKSTITCDKKCTGKAWGVQFEIWG